MMTLTLHGVAAVSEATVGAWRISALSDRLVRVEPRGPRGFEDSQTFSIVGRSKFEGIALKQINGELPGRYAAHAEPPLTIPCSITRADTTFATDSYVVSLRPSAAKMDFSVASPSGEVLYDTTTAAPVVKPNLLHWPSPLTAQSYALVDYPRFSVPPWGPAPIPPNASVDPDLKETHGYDFRVGTKLVRTRRCAQHPAHPTYVNLPARLAEQRRGRHLRLPPWFGFGRLVGCPSGCGHSHWAMPTAARLRLRHMVHVVARVLGGRGEG